MKRYSDEELTYALLGAIEILESYKAEMAKATDAIVQCLAEIAHREDDDEVQHNI